MAGVLPPALKDAHPLDANAWNAWVRSEDAEIRKRLERGEEDTLTNQLRFGVTYTKEYRIDREYLSSYGHSTLVDAFAQNRAAGQAAGKATRSVARGVGGFLRPFSRVGGILWLEVMGVFFFLPVVVFAPTLWRARASYLSGPDHRTFLVTAAVMAVFLYLSVSSFWRARRK